MGVELLKHAAYAVLYELLVVYRVDIEIADGELCYLELLERIDALRERSYAQQKKNQRTHSRL